MNILIVTLGSRGDVQPYVALGKGLHAAGHTVTVCTSVSFESFITGHGLKYGYMSNDLLDLMDSAQGRDAMENTVGVAGAIRTTMKLMKEANAINKRLLKDTWETAQAANPDVVIYHPKALGGPHIAEKLGVPVAMAIPAPLIVPTGDFPVIGLPGLPLGRGYNRFSYAVIKRGYSVYNGMVNEFRQDTLGLNKLPGAALAPTLSNGQPLPVLHCISPQVVPRPEDWPAHISMTGYWFLDQETWEPSADLQNFLDAGEPPVYVGFGSMAGRDPQRLATIVVEALQQAGVRGILATGWGGLETSQLPDTILKIDQVPHDWLFPRVAAVVHHGGAGTTAAGLRAGRPTVICSFFADQPFWGQRVHALGVGSQPIPQKKLTVGKLADAIREVTTNPAIRENAAAVGERIRHEDGIANALAVIEPMGERARHPSA